MLVLQGTRNSFAMAGSRFPNREAYSTRTCQHAYHHTHPWQDGSKRADVILKRYLDSTHLIIHHSLLMSLLSLLSRCSLFITCPAVPISQLHWRHSFYSLPPFLLAPLNPLIQLLRDSGFASPDPVYQLYRSVLRCQASNLWHSDKHRLSSRRSNHMTSHSWLGNLAHSNKRWICIQIMSYRCCSSCSLILVRIPFDPVVRTKWGRVVIRWKGWGQGLISFDPPIPVLNRQQQERIQEDMRTWFH